MTTSSTPTSILSAILSDDEAAAQQLIAGLSAGEISNLAGACIEMLKLLNAELNKRSSQAKRVRTQGI